VFTDSSLGEEVAGVEGADDSLTGVSLADVEVDGAELVVVAGSGGGGADVLAAVDSAAGSSTGACSSSTGVPAPPADPVTAGREVGLSTRVATGAA
jgi:hypothetical protein